MELYIGNLPPSATVLELRQLLGPCANEARYQLVQRSDAAGAVHCFARVRVPSDAEARQVMAELQHAGTFAGRQLEIRRFQERNAFNDRRAPWWRAEPWQGVERRRGDRRTSS